MNKNLTCPHCHARVPRGATVCRGCKAELEYGTPAWLYLFPFVIATFAAPYTVAFAYRWLHIRSENVCLIIGLTTFIGVMGYLCSLLNKLFSNRVVFRRFYRTR